MIEKTVLDYLSKKLDVPCYMEVPATMPQEFVVIEKLGSSRTNFVNYASFAIQSYSTSTYKAALLNEKVKEAMFDIVDLKEISSSELDGDYLYTDTSIKRARYQCIFDMHHY